MAKYHLCTVPNNCGVNPASINVRLRTNTAKYFSFDVRDFSCITELSEQLKQWRWELSIFVFHKWKV